MRTDRQHLLILAVALLLLAQSASAQTWNGLGGNDNWQTGLNWNTTVAPLNNGTANVFFGGTTRLTPNVDVGYSINSLTFNNGSGLFTISGSALAIGAGGITNNDADMQTINSSINVNASQTWGAISGPLTFNSLIGLNGSSILVFNAATGTSTISGGIANTGSLTKGGFGTLILSGGANNGFSGPFTINAGTVIFNKTPGLRAFGGTLILGDGSGTDTVQYLASNQTSNPNITINSSGLLDLNGFSDVYTNLNLNGGSIITGAGTLQVGSSLNLTGGSISSTGAGKLQLFGNLNSFASANTATISGTLDMSGFPIALAIADGLAEDDLDISASIINGGLTKNGTGTLRLSGSAPNTYTSATTINAGTLKLAKSAGPAVALDLTIGDGAGGANADVVRYFANHQIADSSHITISSSGLLDLNGFSDTVGSLTLLGGNVTTGGGILTLSGSGNAVGAGTSSQMPTLSGGLSLNNAAKGFQITDSPGLPVDLDVAASLQDGQLTKLGTGRMRLSGAAANTLGSISVNEGNLRLAKSIADAAITGSLIIGDGAGLDFVELEGPNQIADTATITINSSGVLDLLGQSDTVGPITLQAGGNIITGAGTLTAAGDVTLAAGGTSAQQALIQGNLALSGQRTFNIDDTPLLPDLNINANITAPPGPPATLVKDGPGALGLGGNNTAAIILNAGTLLILNDNALSSNLALLNGGTLHSSGTRTLTTPLDFAASAIVALQVDGTLNLNGLLSGTGTVAKTGPGILNLPPGLGTALDWVLEAGNLNATNMLVGPQGSFTMDGGLFNGSLENRGTFTYNAGNFNGALTNRGRVLINNSVLTLGSLTNFGDLELAGGTDLTTGDLTNNGSIAISGSTLLLFGVGINNTSITGFGTINSASAFTNNGLIRQGEGNLTLSGIGAKTNNGNIDLAPGRQLAMSGAPLLNQGTINLNGATIGAGAALNNAAGGTVAGRGTILAPFTNTGLLLVSGGTLNLVVGLTNTGTIAINGLGSTLITSGMTNQGTMQGSGVVGGEVTNQATIEAIGGTLIFTGFTTNSGTIAASGGNKVLFNIGLGANTGIINLTGGTFDNNNIALNNGGQVSGYGTFRALSFTNNGSMTFSGGTTTINGNVTNAATKQIRVAYNPAIFTGNVVNNGIFKNTSTTITFAGTYTENGLFISDPADNFFNNVNIGPGGAWVGGVGDRFFVSGDFHNQSTQALAWNTSDAELHLLTGGGDVLSVNGQDLGTSFDGYDDNFAWGGLSLAAGRSLLLIDADSTSGGAVYVGHLDLKGGIDQISAITGNGMTLYYHLGNPNNAYLQGKTYQLAGGGTIAPVPEPAALFLVMIGAPLLGARGRKLRRVCFSTPRRSA